MKTRILVFTVFLLFTACESETKIPEAPEVHIIEVRETGKIAAAWEAEAAAWEAMAAFTAVAFGEEHGQSELEVAAEKREQAAAAEEVSLEMALKEGLSAQEWVSDRREFLRTASWKRPWYTADELRYKQAELEAWERVLQAWTEVIEATE